jgi:hypothetical protein
MEHAFIVLERAVMYAQSDVNDNQFAKDIKVCDYFSCILSLQHEVSRRI